MKDTNEFISRAVPKREATGMWLYIVMWLVGKLVDRFVPMKWCITAMEISAIIGQAICR